MDFFSFLTMIGGLALFLFGMKTMGDALSKLAGGKLEQLLEKMTNTPIKAVLLGAGVTAVIQSSSATTVMVVGFVNSGIMKLSQAVGVIMGANIGTTITAWMLSLTGIQGDSFLLKMLKPSSFSPILALIGIILIMFIKDDKKNDIGTILIGFAVLMFGMETMSGAVKPLANVPEFTSLFTAFENPAIGMLVGAVLTAIIQSSSASVGILQALCATGSVTIGAAIPVIMGQNIGTCVTALISAIGASRNARRASLVHLFFNLIGTITFMVVFYTINVFVSFAFLKDTASGATIAVIHSAFNICATIVLLPLSAFIEKLAYLAIPEGEEEQAEEEPKVLDVRFLERPAFAVAQARTAAYEMARLAEESVNLIGQNLSSYDKSYVQKVMEIEEDMDVRQDELTDYLTKISQKPLSEADSHLVSKFMRCTIEIERISDYAKAIAYSEKKVEKSKEEFSKKAKAELMVMISATQEIMDNAISSYVHDDVDLAISINPLADVISGLKKEIRKNHNKRLEKGRCSAELGIIFADTVSSLERIARHCSNIAEEVIASNIDEYNLHQYTKNFKEGNELYKEMLEEYKEKYAI